MTLKGYLLAQLDREVDRSRRVLEQVPENKFDWKPHEKSMIFGYLADMVATIPTWIALQVTDDELDISPAGGSKLKREPGRTSTELIAALDASAAAARKAFEATTDEHLRTHWQLKFKGMVVQDAPRYTMIQDTFNHWAHHRGQMTVYLRLLGAMVPAVYGPSADEQSFR